MNNFKRHTNDLPLTINQKWFYQNVKSYIGSYDDFMIIDEDDYIVAEHIREEDVVISIINNHNKGIN